MKSYWLTLICLLQCGLQIKAGCNRKPQGASGERSPVDENFQILIDGNPSTYIPGQLYNISLSCPINMKFISFTVTLETEDTGANSPFDMTGNFRIYESADTRFSSLCENMVESTNTNPKTRIEVGWLAPTNPESGCILVRAGVLQHRDVWFIDDGLLTKRICPEEIDEINTLTRPIEQCCACDEAKYEIVIERKWTRNTHAKDFPEEPSRTRFSEIVGASHTFDYRFWQYGSSASKGLEELGEHGATQTLEEEIKDNINNGNVRTIIKAPGIFYRKNVMGTTLANARVDPKHHMISLVTKIEPSPDWILGVAGLELCLSNCTWIEKKVLNLYPWDIGTDSGPSYMSPDQEQLPPDVVRRITSSYPSDPRSPFFEESGAPMKPLASLYITRKKLYPRECEEMSNAPLECATHPWNSWSDCSMRCGPGNQYRLRFYKNAALAESFNCDLELREDRTCVGEQCGVSEDKFSPSGSSDAECELGVWGMWSACSKRCGKGVMKRNRDYKNPYAREKCQEGLYTELEQTRDCVGNDCGGVIPGSYNTGDEEDMDNFNENEPDSDQISRTSWNQYSLGRNRNRYGKIGTEMESDTYGNRRQDSRYNQNYGSNRSQRPNYNDNEQEPAADDDTVPQQNIYGSEKLVGYGNRPYEAPDNEDSNFGSRYTTTSSRYQAQRGQQQSPDENRFSYASPGFAGRPAVAARPDNTGIEERYGNEGRKMVVVAGNEPRDYRVVQEYCFQKPYVSRRPCNMKKVIDRNYWFYDADNHECQLFTTDNCDQNKNKFKTLKACEATCRNPRENLEESNIDVTGEMGEGDPDGFGAPQSQVRDRYNNKKRKSTKYH